MSNTPNLITQPMIDLYDRFTHIGGTRRELLAGLARLTGGMAAASALLPLLEARAEAAPLSAPDDPRLVTKTVHWDGAGDHKMAGYMTYPTGNTGDLPRAIVIHENRGLNEHTRDVARRLALAGFVVLAPDFLAPVGGTPSVGDGATPAEDVARTMIGKLDRVATVADGVATLRWLAGQPQGRGAAGAVGFCWGGGMVNALAVAAGADLKAGVAYYGQAADANDAGKVQSKIMLHYAGLDERINAMGPAWQAALKAAGKTYEAHMYEGVNHAFNNDTSEARYNKAAADLAWGRTLAWLR